MKKQAVLLGLAALGAWWLNRQYSSEEQYFIETDDYSNNNGGFIRAAFNIASGELGMMTNSELPNEHMQVSAAYTVMLKKYENGIKKGWDAKKQKWFVHLDSAGYPTIAYGHLLQNGENFSAGISEAEATGLMLSDIQTRLNVVRKTVKIALSQGEFDAMIDFVYNAGQGNFLGTSRTAKKLGNNIPKAINTAKDFGAGFDQITKHYNYVVTLPDLRSSANGLLNRLRTQYLMAFNNQYS